MAWVDNAYCDPCFDFTFQHCEQVADGTSSWTVESSTERLCDRQHVAGVDGSLRCTRGTFLH